MAAGLNTFLMNSLGTTNVIWVASIPGSCIRSVAAAQHLAPEMLQQNSQSPQQQGFAFCAKTQAPSVVASDPHALQMLLWMAVGVSWVWYQTWQPLTASLKMPEVAQLLGSSCVMSQATI